jgi:hypothetical protein
MAKNIAKRLFEVLGYEIRRKGTFVPTPPTTKAELQDLLTKLAPVSPSNPLIRIGPNKDGGYLVPDDLTDIEACFSPGVDVEAGFEEACANMGMKVFLADHSVSKPPVQHELFKFTQHYVGVTTSAEFITLDEWICQSDLQTSSDLLLQIDIEGFEYEVFLAASDTLLKRFRIIVAEFHNLDHLVSQPFFRLAGRAFDKLLQTHVCVHMHPNNCCGQTVFHDIEIPRIMEFTFMRRDRITAAVRRDDFPHPLDVDNTTNASLPLPECWYRKA